ncbi:MAG: PhzF family phenazine biosynthesis protein [Reichenbachiella sp.]
MKTISTYVVDSFTDQAFKGNPAGVCLLQEDMSESTMLSIANELGYSETAFVSEKADGTYAIRFFTPKMEIPLCGHATLASAKVLFHVDDNLRQVKFVNINDLQLSVSLSKDQIEIRFPTYETVAAEASHDLLDAIGITELVNVVFNKETNILILEIGDSEELSALTPDFEALYKSHDQINGVSVTARSKDAAYDFESRYFWPWSGTNEDPVTGATHTFLAAYWSERLGKTKMKAYQCSERSGFMEVELINDQEMLIRGEAQLVLEGKLYI